MRAYLHHTEKSANERITTFWFKTEKPLRYDAGQFIDMTIPHNTPDERGIRRWFTLSSSPTEQLIAITTKLAEKPSTFKQHLFALKSGDEVQISDSMGDFVLPKDQAVPLLFVAGGIGITPVHSMLSYLHATGQKRTAQVLYNAANAAEIAFRQTLDQTADHATYLTDRRLTTDDILKVAHQYTKPLLYISGPEEMVEQLVAELKQAGVPGSRLVTDYFPGYANRL